MPPDYDDRLKKLITSLNILSHRRVNIDKFRTVLKLKKYKKPFISGSPNKIKHYMIGILLFFSLLGIADSLSCFFLFFRLF